MTGGVSAVVARGLAKVYAGGVVALHELDLEVRSGEVLGLVGQNGAGKTTALSLLAGRLRPTGGAAAVLGIDAARDPLGVRRLAGFLPGDDDTFERLTGREIVELCARLHGLAPAEAVARTRDLLDLLDLAESDRDRLADTYSTGMRRKVQLACALVHAPRVLLLDEPLTGLDPIAAAVVRRLVRDLAARGRAIVVSSHALDAVERLCDRIVVLHDGRVRASGTLVELRAASGCPPDAALEDVFLALVGEGGGGATPEWLR